MANAVLMLLLLIPAAFAKECDSMSCDVEEHEETGLMQKTQKTLAQQKSGAKVAALYEQDLKVVDVETKAGEGLAQHWSNSYVIQHGAAFIKTRTEANWDGDIGKRQYAALCMAQKRQHDGSWKEDHDPPTMCAAQCAWEDGTYHGNEKVDGKSGWIKLWKEYQVTRTAGHDELEELYPWTGKSDSGSDVGTADRSNEDCKLGSGDDWGSRNCECRLYMSTWMAQR